MFTVTKTDKTENKLDTLILFVCFHYFVDARSDKLINILVRTSLSVSKGYIYRMLIGLSSKPSESLFPIIFAGFPPLLDSEKEVTMICVLNFIMMSLMEHLFYF